MNEYYYTIEKSSTAEFKDRGSKFIAYAYPVGSIHDFKKYLQQLKKDHPKAVHHCFAYRIGTDSNNFRSSDDGEPAGTAGKPILGQIDSKALTNIGIIVVRYWGGTLLGVPGLINAYKTSASLALQIIPIVKRAIEVQYCIEFDYTKMNDIMIIMKQNNCTIVKQEMQLFCQLIVGIAMNKLEDVLSKLKEITNLQIKKLNNNL